jgi:hypothetical protein
VDDDTSRTVPIETPTPRIDPRIALASSLQAAPGVYAVLGGSGMSTAAGIPTGWQVVEDLIREIARAADVDSDSAGQAPAELACGDVRAA